jgi:hypothetical protein
MRDILEGEQVWIGFGCIAFGAVVASVTVGTKRLETAIIKIVRIILTFATGEGVNNALQRSTV